jgi:NADH-quinone oxidoreductase subunit A
MIGSGPSGPVKDSPYESGMPVIGDARRRFNVKFYLVAMMFLLFDVEVVLMWPWAAVFHTSATAPDHPIYQQLVIAGAEHPPTFLLVTGGLFFGLLTIGLLYDVGKGIFKWS